MFLDLLCATGCEQRPKLGPKLGGGGYLIAFCLLNIQLSRVQGKREAHTPIRGQHPIVELQ